MTPVPTPNRPIQRPLSSVQTARRTGIAKAIILPRQDDFLPNLTAFGGLLFGSAPTLPPSQSTIFRAGFVASFRLVMPGGESEGGMRCEASWPR